MRPLGTGQKLVIILFLLIHLLFEVLKQARVTRVRGKKVSMQMNYRDLSAIIDCRIH